MSNPTHPRAHTRVPTACKRSGHAVSAHGWAVVGCAGSDPVMAFPNPAGQTSRTSIVLDARGVRAP